MTVPIPDDVPTLVITDGAGPQGVPGAPGPSGPSGADGAGGADSTVVGPAGPAGSPGSPGSPGSQGTVGPTGARGLTGATGATGAASTVPGPGGPAGVDSTVPGPAGVAGPSGVAGPAGADGAIGPAGPAGAAGGSGTFGPYVENAGMVATAGAGDYANEVQTGKWLAVFTNYRYDPTYGADQLWFLPSASLGGWAVAKFGINLAGLYQVELETNFFFANAPAPPTWMTFEMTSDGMIPAASVTLPVLAPQDQPPSRGGWVATQKGIAAVVTFPVFGYAGPDENQNRLVVEISYRYGVAGAAPVLCHPENASLPPLPTLVGIRRINAS